MPSCGHHFRVARTRATGRRRPPGRSPKASSPTLWQIRERYRRQAYKTAASIGAAIVEHCLWYFVRPGGTAKMVIEDDGEALQLDEIYEQMMHASAVPQELTIKGEELHLLHVKLRAKANAAHVVA